MTDFLAYVLGRDPLYQPESSTTV